MKLKGLLCTLFFNICQSMFELNAHNRDIGNYFSIKGFKIVNKCVKRAKILEKWLQILRCNYLLIENKNYSKANKLYSKKVKR